ncbi:hypothetical protein M426DRAFT_28833 [Hypoxylon sp. CI-4A]|nr:hypothetical protein M426DRAFT_28833 [Hypoxylon sp. CI-4A]
MTYTELIVLLHKPSGPATAPTPTSLTSASSTSSSLTSSSSSQSSSLTTSSTSLDTTGFSTSSTASDGSSTETGGPTSQSSSAESTTESFSLTPVTSFPEYTAPTTTITGAAETSTAAGIAPLFEAVWRNRGDLQDSKNKQRYVDDVTSTKNQYQVDSLYNNLPDKSDPPSECSNTSGSGSIISGIKNLLTTPAKLISCASKVTGNLVDEVNKVDPEINTVEVLTDTLQDIGSQLKSQNENPTSTNDPTNTDNSSTGESSSSTQSSTSSECSTTAAPSCAETVTVSTSWYTDSTTTTSSVQTVTTTTCATITACSAQATTATTTVSTATTSSGQGWICDSTCAAGGCAASKRTAIDPAPTEASHRARDLQRRSLKPTSRITDADKNIIQILEASNSEELNWYSLTGVVAVSQYWRFLNKANNKYVTNVVGCTSITIISEKGVWMSHFMETGFMLEDGRKSERDRMDQSVQNGDSRYVKPSGYAGDDGDLNKDSTNVQVYVSAPCETKDDGSGNEVCDEEDGDTKWMYKERLNSLLNTLTGPGTPFDGVKVTKRGYIKPADRETVDNLADSSARGKVVAQYDPIQFTDDFQQNNPRHAKYRVWLESTPYDHEWVASACQGGNAPNQKRDDSCPISSSSSTSARSSQTSPSGTTASSTATSSATSISSTTFITSSKSQQPSSLIGSTSSSESSSSTQSATSQSSTDSASSTRSSLPSTQSSSTQTSASTSTEEPTSTTSSAPSPTATWHLTAYNTDCETQKDSSDFSYYALSGYDDQSPNETCIKLKGDLQTSSDTTNSCGWYQGGGFTGPDPCSQGSFDQPASFSILTGFCTIYKNDDCTGDHNGVDSMEYSGCTSVKDGWVDLDGWGSMRCFAMKS